MKTRYQKSENYLNTAFDNNVLWIILHNNALAAMLNLAEEQEKRYEWLKAADLYKKASVFPTKEKDSLGVAELQEKIGFCYFRAAFQARTNKEYRKYMKQSVETYEKELKLLEELEETDKGVRIAHANALIAYTRARLETNLKKKKELLNQWWITENQVLDAYEQAGDLHTVVRICNNLIENNIYDRVWLVSSGLEHRKIFEECVNLAQKSLRILSNLDDDYELARANCFAGWYCQFSDWVLESEDEIIQLNQKSQEYLNKALKLSQKIRDARLSSWSYFTAYGSNALIYANPALGIENTKKALKYGRIAKDNHLIGCGQSFLAMLSMTMAKFLQDPDKQKETFKKARKMLQEAICNFRIINFLEGLSIAYPPYIFVLTNLAAIETNQNTKQRILEKATQVTYKGIKCLTSWPWQGLLYFYLSMNLFLLSEKKTESREKRDLLEKAKKYAKEYLAASEKMVTFNFKGQSDGHYRLALIYYALTRMETSLTRKNELLKKAANSIEKSLELIQKKKKLLQSAWASGFFFGKYYDKLGTIQQEIYSLTREKKSFRKAIEAYKNASLYYEKAEAPAHVAESYWHLAQLHDEQTEYQKASRNYNLASKVYESAAAKIPQLKDFYKNYSLYMQAWSQIEQARYNHSIENYDKAKRNYDRASKLHESTDSWSYLASNYSAWTIMEKAEDLSRKEITQQAKETFQKALEQFTIAQKAINQKIGETASAEEKELNQKLLQAADLRRKFCQARIQIEDAKILGKQGKYLQSSKSYEEAAQNILSIIDKVESEAERKELEYLAVLCRAWERMAEAEATTSSESYLEAAELFEKAKDHCFTRKASLWALGNSSFCKGLAAGIAYQSSLDMNDHFKAKGYMKGAATSYLQSGYANASDYAKGTQRLFDAYMYMNKAEGEADPEKSMKYYSLAEKVLKISAQSFNKANQPEKESQVQQILANVKEEKALAISLSEIMQAPTIASTTSSFTAPTPTSEVSVGLEQFQHANVQANLIAGLREVKVGESFCLSVEFVNAGKEPALLTRVEDFVPPDFIVVKKPEIYRLEDTCLNMKGKQIAPLKLVEAKLVLQPLKKGVYQLKPTAHYLDELGQNKTLQLKAVEIKVEEIVLSDRISTGTKELDS
ncbi:hypothetical protein AC477_05645, partial [miscellaneous Crenarchaeota group-1 archaeon SG8-32-1]